MAARRGAGLRARVDLRPPVVALAAGPALVRHRADPGGRGDRDLDDPARDLGGQPQLPPPGAVRQGADEPRRHQWRALRPRRRLRRGGRRRHRPRRPAAAVAADRPLRGVRRAARPAAHPPLDHVAREFYAADDARMLPGGPSTPRLPFVVAANGPRGMGLAARLGQGWATTGPAGGGALEDWWAGVAAPTAPSPRSSSRRAATPTGRPLPQRRRRRLCAGLGGRLPARPRPGPGDRVHRPGDALAAGRRRVRRRRAPCSRRSRPGCPGSARPAPGRTGAAPPPCAGRRRRRCRPRRGGRSGRRVAGAQQRGLGHDGGRRATSPTAPCHGAGTGPSTPPTRRGPSAAHGAPAGTVPASVST